MGGNNGSVSKTRDGKKWKGEVKGVNVGEFETQQKAIKAVTKIIKEKGGGDITIFGEDGKIRTKNTVAPGNDPYPPPG